MVLILRSPAGAREVLRMMSEGKTNAEIGSAFSVTDHAIEKYLQEVVYKMVGCKASRCSVKRAEAVGNAFRIGILP